MIRERDEKGRIKPFVSTSACHCGKPAGISGMCQRHYKNWWQNQDKEKRREQARVQYQKNKSRMNAASRAWASNHKEEIKSHQKKWRKENPEKVRAAKLAWEMANPGKVRAMEVARQLRRDKEEVRARVKAWQQANPDKFKAQMANLRAKRRSAQGTFTALEIQSLFLRQKGCCAVCKLILPKRYHKDHIIPLARGGSNYIANIQLLCPPCNGQKHARDPIEFMQARGYLI